MLKKAYYAEAGIPWYLLVDPSVPSVQLFHLGGNLYKEYAAAAPGMPLQLTEPVVVTIDPAELLPPS